MSNGRAVPVNTPVQFDLPSIPAWAAPNPANEADDRARVVAEARSWIGTAYHHRGSVKFVSASNRGGVDCAHFPFRVYHAVGLVPWLDLGEYPPDWFLHQGAERYLPWVEALARRVETPKPGDFVIYKVGRLFAHGAIAVDWPLIVHAVRDADGVILDHGDGGNLAKREHLFFSPWG